MKRVITLFDNKNSLVRYMIENGAHKVLFKCLAENDNNKQQIYLGGSFEALNQLPYGDVYPDNINGKKPNYKAVLDFYWISYEGKIEKAPGAQLILYPKYPEVRLSGFLEKCSIAPREYLRPVPREERRFNNGKDGRILVLGVCNDGRILAYLVLPEAPLANELARLSDDSRVFTFLDTTVNVASKSDLLLKIKEIEKRGWISASRMNSQGEIIHYNASNAGGYTFEAYLGIIPNGKAEPDWLGWEIKAYTNKKITLMTPEPDDGYYSEYRVEGFLKKYGRKRPQGDWYFTGIHKCDVKNISTKMELILDGYNENTKRIDKVTGGIVLLDSNEEPAAIWTFAKLLEHWGRKHSNAAFIPYKKRKILSENEYMYLDPILLGEGTDFSKFLSAFKSGIIVYDPGSKLFINERDNLQVKARNQFRIKVTDLSILYHNFTSEVLDT